MRESIGWLKEKYGHALHTVIEHLDESHPHIHFYVVPELGQRFEGVHQGKAAAAAAKNRGLKKGEQNEAYKCAMRDFQDEFYNRVGTQHGFTRIGPGRRRLTREEWRLEQVQASAAASSMAKAGEMMEDSRQQARELIRRAKKQADGVASVALKDAEIIKKQAMAEGFSSGISNFEERNLWRKITSLLSSAVRERDRLRVEKKDAEKEQVNWRAKAKKYFAESKRSRTQLDKVTPELDAALEELSLARVGVKEAERLRRQNRALADELHAAKSANEPLKASVESLSQRISERYAEVKRPSRRLRKDSDLELIG